MKKKILNIFLTVCFTITYTGIFAINNDQRQPTDHEIDFNNLKAQFSWYQDWNEDLELFTLYPGYKKLKISHMESIAEKYDYDKRNLKSFTRIEYSPYVRHAGIYRTTGFSYIANGEKLQQLADQSIEASPLNLRIEQTFIWQDFLTFSFDGEMNINLKPSNRAFQTLPLVGIVLNHGATYTKGSTYTLSRSEMREVNSGFNEETRQGSHTTSSYSADGKTRYDTTSYYNYRVLKNSSLPSGYAYATLLEFGPRIFWGNSALSAADNMTMYGVPNFSEKPPVEISLRWRHLYWEAGGFFNGSRHLEIAYQPETKLATIYGEINHLFVLGLGYSFPLGEYKLNDNGSSFTRGVTARLGMAISF